MNGLVGCARMRSLWQLNYIFAGASYTISFNEFDCASHGTRDERKFRSSNIHRLSIEHQKCEVKHPRRSVRIKFTYSNPFVCFKSMSRVWPRGNRVYFIYKYTYVCDGSCGMFELMPSTYSRMHLHFIISPNQELFGSVFFLFFFFWFLSLSWVEEERRMIWSFSINRFVSTSERKHQRRQQWTSPSTLFKLQQPMCALQWTATGKRARRVSRLSIVNNIFF